MPAISDNRAGGIITATSAAMVRYVPRLAGRYLRHAHHIRQPGRWGHRRYLGCHGQVCSPISWAVSMARPPYLAVKPVGSSPLPGPLPLISQSVSTSRSLYPATRAGGVITATSAAMVRLCFQFGLVVSTRHPPYPAVEPVGLSPLPGLPLSGMFSDRLGGIYVTPTISGSWAGGVIAATWAAMVRYALSLAGRYL